ncbi:DUF6390 family protein [Patescibacteria group bacterium]
MGKLRFQEAVFHIKPSALGYCAQRADSTVIRDYLQGKKTKADLVEALSHYEAASAYFHLIAEANNFETSYHPEVVRAYWLGNDLLKKVQHFQFQRMISRVFAKPGLLSQEEAARRAKRLPVGLLPHHSAHVLGVGPVAGKFDPKSYENPILVLDQCLVRWGQVKKLGQSKLSAAYQPLVYKNGVIGLEDRERSIPLHFDETLVGKVIVGDWIAFHWLMTCQVLTANEKEDLERFTVANFEVINQHPNYIDDFLVKKRA